MVVIAISAEVMWTLSGFAANQPKFSRRHEVRLWEPQGSGNGVFQNVIEQYRLAHLCCSY
jgi:hypothetical protein